MHCPSHGIRAGSGLENFNSQGSWLHVTETQLTASSKRGNLLACKTEKSKLDVIITRFSEICRHKAVSMNNLFILSFYPSIICVLSVASSVISCLSVCHYHHHHFFFSLFFLYSWAESQNIITVLRIVFTSQLSISMAILAFLSHNSIKKLSYR